MCRYTLGSRNVAHCLRVTVTLTLNSGLNSKKSCLCRHLSHCDTFLVILAFIFAMATSPNLMSKACEKNVYHFICSFQIYGNQREFEIHLFHVFLILREVQPNKMKQF